MVPEAQTNLGLATTRELLDELRTRIEVDGKLDYRTVDGGELERAPNLSLRQIAGPSLDDELPETNAPAERVLPEGKRVVRTKTSGDRVYLLDETKGTRQWVTNPEVLKSLGFESSDVTEIDDDELLKFQMGPALYRVDG